MARLHACIPRPAGTTDAPIAHRVNTPQPGNRAAPEAVPETTTEEALIFNLCICEHQLKAAIDAAAKGGIVVAMVSTPCSGAQWQDRSMTDRSDDWTLQLRKDLHYPEATP